jgi:hypothetical protein
VWVLFEAVDGGEIGKGGVMALKIWTDFNLGDRVMAGDCQRDIGTVLEIGPDATVAGRALVQWDDGAPNSWLRADLLSPSSHIEDEAWEYVLDLLLSGEIDTAEFRRQAAGAGYCVEQINNAIDFNWDEIASNMLPEAKAA